MLDRPGGRRSGHPVFLGLALIVFALAGCGRQEEHAKPASSAPVSAAPRGTPMQASSERGAGVQAEEAQPDFLKHPPIHLKPPCQSSSEGAPNEEGRRCVALTLRCSELDSGESVWLATTPPVARLKLPEGSKGLRVAVEDEVSATVCCKAAGEPGPAKAQIRLFTDDVAGSAHTLECP